MQLPNEYVERGLKLATGCTMFGIPLEQLSRDELRAALANEMQRLQKQVGESQALWRSLARLKHGL